MKRAVIRLPPDVVHRLDQLTHKLRVAHPGRGCSRASLVRALITSGLAVAEVEGEGKIEGEAIPAAGLLGPAGSPAAEEAAP